MKQMFKNTLKNYGNFHVQSFPPVISDVNSLLAL